MGTKITFDADTREFVVTQAPVDGVIEIDLQVDLYSDGKEDWLASPLLHPMRFPIDAIGGNPWPTGNLGVSYLIKHGWSFRPYDADHTMRIVGNIATEFNWELVLDTVGAYRVRVENEISAIVEVRTDQSSLESLIRIEAGVYGVKAMRPSPDPATTPGYIVLYDQTMTIVGHKEIWQDGTDLVAPTLGWVKGKDIMYEGALTAGSPP